MIVIKVELWPYGSKEHAREIGRAYLYNDGTVQDPTKGSYNIYTAKSGWFDEARSKFGSKYQDKRGRVENFPRGHKNLWPLIVAALKSCNFRRVKGEPTSHGHLPERVEP